MEFRISSKMPNGSTLDEEIQDREFGGVTVWFESWRVRRDDVPATLATAWPLDTSPTSSNFARFEGRLVSPAVARTWAPLLLWTILRFAAPDFFSALIEIQALPSYLFCAPQRYQPCQPWECVILKQSHLIRQAGWCRHRELSLNDSHILEPWALSFIADLGPAFTKRRDSNVYSLSRGPLVTTTTPRWWPLQFDSYHPHCDRPLEPRHFCYVAVSSFSIRLTSDHLSMILSCVLVDFLHYFLRRSAAGNASNCFWTLKEATGGYFPYSLWSCLGLLDTWH